MSNEADDFASLVPRREVNRRNFLVSTLGAGFALAVQPVVASATISTPDTGLIAGEVKIPVADGEVPAYRAMPSDKPNAPLVLVVSEIFGVHEYIKDVCRRLARAGYCAVATELFARQGDPRKYSSIPELQAAITSKTSDAQVMRDLDASVIWAAGQGADVQRLVITGFCWGGRITWLYCAHNPQVRAGVAWYGRLVGVVNDFTPRHPTDVAGELKAPVLGLYGGLDTGIPLDTVEAMEKKLATGSLSAQASLIEVFDNAPHAFHADYRPSYRKQEAEEGWQKMLAWFARGVA